MHTEKRGVTMETFCPPNQMCIPELHNRSCVRTEQARLRKTHNMLCGQLKVLLQTIPLGKVSEAVCLRYIDSDSLHTQYL